MVILLFLLPIICATDFAAATGRATDSDPADYKHEVRPLNVRLGWSCEDALTYDVYFGTDPEALVLKSAGQTELFYDLGKLDFCTEYYWRIDSFGGSGEGRPSRTGIVWTFRTSWYTDLIDIAYLTERWLDTCGADDCRGADRNDSGKVNMGDYAQLVQWYVPPYDIPKPPRLLSAYMGFWLAPVPTSLSSTITGVIDPMQAANFTAVDFKLFPTDLDLASAPQFDALRDLADAIKQRGLVFLVYVYPHPHTGYRDPSVNGDLPAFVDQYGVEDENSFSMIHWPVWRRIFDNAFQLAEFSREFSIGAVRLDIEKLAFNASYDDDSWALFAGVYGLDPNTLANQRYALLQTHGFTGTYETWFDEQLEVVAQQFEHEMHLLNPDLMLGIMPIHRRICGPFVKHLATAQAPAIMDDWAMYNGESYGSEVLAEQARVKAANPYNLYIPWFRINSYYPYDIMVQAYHAGFMTDGHSSWNVSMLQGSGHTGETLYDLPENYDPCDYWSAYGTANTQILTDLADGMTEPTSIPWEPVTPIAPPLDIGSVTVPNLQPAGNGTGTPKRFVLRERSIIYIYAESDENIHIKAEHLAGASRPVALHYVVVDSGLNILREGTVNPSESEDFTVSVPATGTYALVITGGDGGQAWYGVTVYNEHMGLYAAEPHAYFFKKSPNPCEFWVTRTNAINSASVTISTGTNQVFYAKLNGGSPVDGSSGSPVTFSLPTSSTVHSIYIGITASPPPGTYVQDWYVTVQGAVEPYLANGPERRLVTP